LSRQEAERRAETSWEQEEEAAGVGQELMQSAAEDKIQREESGQLKPLSKRLDCQLLGAWRRERKAQAGIFLRLQIAKI